MDLRMPDPHRPSDAAEDTSTPRWVKVLRAMILALVLLVVMHMAGAGPGLHVPAGVTQHSGPLS
jgi:hypothetical protein